MSSLRKHTHSALLPPRCCHYDIVIVPLPPPLLMRRRAAVTGHHDLTRPDPLGFSCLVVLATRYKTTYRWLHSGYMTTSKKPRIVGKIRKCLILLVPER